jgi:hypothetical protein
MQFVDGAASPIYCFCLRKGIPLAIAEFHNTNVQSAGETMGNLVKILSATAIFSALTGPLAAQPALQVGTPPPAAAAVSKPPIAMTSKPMKTLQLSKVLLDTETITTKGKIKGGTWCVFPSPVKLDKVKKTEDYERYDVPFSDKLKFRGYKVVTTSQDLFAKDNAEKAADYLIGATVRPDTINMCSSVDGEKGEIILQVEWQIYDRTAQKVVETVTTSGRGEQLKFSTRGYVEIWNLAFADSLDALIKASTLVKYTGEADAEVATANQAAWDKSAAEAAALAAAEEAKKKARH